MTGIGGLQPQGRCHSQHQVTVRVTVRCEREFGHGGAHSATVDDIAIDPDYTYVISWWPQPSVSSRSPRTGDEGIQRG